MATTALALVKVVAPLDARAVVVAVAVQDVQVVAVAVAVQDAQAVAAQDVLAVVVAVVAQDAHQVVPNRAVEVVQLHAVHYVAAGVAIHAEELVTNPVKEHVVPQTYLVVALPLHVTVLVTLHVLPLVKHIVIRHVKASEFINRYYGNNQG